MTVTTLPITPGKHNSFVTLFGPLIADVFSRLTSNPLKLMLNVVHSFRSFEKEAQKYLHQLGCLGIKPSLVVYDSSDGYQNYIRYKAIKLLSIYQPRPKITLIVHPLLRVLDSKVELSKSTIDDYLDYCLTPQFARTFLMLGAQWQQSEVAIKALNLYLVGKSVYPKQIFSSTSNATVVTPGNFYNIINSNKILELLKIMRSCQTKLSGDQMVLKSALLG